MNADTEWGAKDFVRLVEFTSSFFKGKLVLDRD